MRPKTKLRNGEHGARPWLVHSTRARYAEQDSREAKLDPSKGQSSLCLTEKKRKDVDLKRLSEKRTNWVE